LEIVSGAHNELWHYTTADALIGILESKQLWATRIDYLNDTEELVGFFDEVLPKIFDRVTTENQQLSKEKLDWLRGVVRGALCEGYFTFVCSFAAIANNDRDREWLCKNGRLSQWRGYGSGGGYALVFCTKQLEDLMKQEASLYSETQLSLSDAEYDMHSIESIVHPENKLRASQLIRELPTLFGGIQSGDYTELENSAHRLFNDLLFPLAVARKNRAFREENEVRLVASFPNPTKQIALNCVSGHDKPIVHHVNRRGVPVPVIHLFEEQKLSNLPVKRIVIGPHQESRSREAAMRSLLDTNGFHQTEVVVSAIPFLE
jgi:hypothetical protein